MFVRNTQQHIIFCQYAIPPIYFALTDQLIYFFLKEYQVCPVVELTYYYTYSDRNRPPAGKETQCSSKYTYSFHFLLVHHRRKY